MEKEHLTQQESLEATMEESRRSLEKIPVITKDGDNLNVFIRSSDIYIQFHLKNITYVGKDLNCILTITPMPVVGSLIPYTTRINLLSQSSRESLARSLKNAFKKLEVNWDLCINQICSKVEYHLNNEENVYFDLTEVEEENTKYLLDPFIAEGQPNMLFGKGGTGKSYLSMAFAIAVTQGVPFLSYYPFEKRKVLFIDYESSKGIFAKRLKMVSAGYGEKGSLLYRHVHQPLSDIADSLREHVRKEGIGLIIVDSAALACGGRPEEAENALRFFNALRTIGCTSLVIAHETKSENKAYPFGSVFFFNSFRNIWNAQSEPDDIGSRALNLGLFHRKSNEDRLHKPKGVRIFFGDSQIDFSKGSTEYWEKELSNIERVEELLRGGAESTKKEISDELDIKSETVKKSLQRLQQSGKAIFDEKSKKWRFEDPLKLVD